MLYNLALTYRASAALRGGVVDDRPLDRCPQTLMSIARPEQVEIEIEKMRAGGYEVLRASLDLSCPACDGAGRTTHKPKGWRKRTAPPAWMLRFETCTACAGKGYTERVEKVFEVPA